NVAELRERQGLQLLVGRDLDQCEVGLRIRAHELAVERGATAEVHLDRVRSGGPPGGGGDDVVVRDDVARAVDDESGADAALRLDADDRGVGELNEVLGGHAALGGGGRELLGRGGGVR